VSVVFQEKVRVTEDHRYFVGEVEYPSVTRILREEGLVDDQWFTEHSAKRGSAVHKAIGYLVAAATALAAPGDRIVLGPSTDGGYYLIGMKRPHAGLFEDITWSTDLVFSQTIARAEVLGLSVVQLPTWYDVDNAETLQLLVDETLDGEPFRAVGAPTPATWTRDYLRTLIQDSELNERIRASRAEGALTR